MIYKATRDIDAAIKAQNWNCQIDEHDDSSAVVTGFTLKCGINLQILFISSADNDVGIRVFRLLQAPADKRQSMLDACNRVNLAYRFTTFVLADDNSVGIQMDIANETQNIGAVAVELLVRLLNITDEAYSTFTKALA